MRKLFFAVFFCCAAFVHAQRLVPFLKGKEWKVYDRVLKQFNGSLYDKVIPASGGLLFVNTQDKWGALNNEGRMVLPQNYLAVEQLNSAVLSARDESGILLTDTNGVAISKERFREAVAYKSGKGLIVVRNRKSKYGIINSKGKTVVDFRYDFAPEHLSDGYLKVAERQPNGEALCGLLDSNFKQVLPLKFHMIEIMYDHHIRTSVNGNQYTLFTPAFNKIYEGQHEPLRIS
jgi:hypothetical protein